ILVSSTLAYLPSPTCELTLTSAGLLMDTSTTDHLLLTEVNVADGVKGKRRGPQKRRLVDKHNEDSAPKDVEMTELERERAELIRRNQEMLAKIGVTTALTELRKAVAAESATANASTRAASEPRPARAPKRARVPEPIRRSTRRTAAASEHNAAAPGEEPGADGAVEAAPTTARGVGIMTQEEYLASKGLPLPEGHFRTDGRFTGWVAPDVAEQLGLAGSAAEAWEQGGGGAFQRKIKKSDVPSHLKAKGWSDARAFAAGQLHKNPNAYFYRHTAPGLDQAQGEWTQEEHDLFVATARKYGVGDKWGLFASYIPSRVGYQCSAYYTQVIIPSGLILDSRYRMDAWGDAVFCGGRGSD
ncbi:hypothetical protein Agub_g4256, partial [Astrephomene gubernaculifera]